MPLIEAEPYEFAFERETAALVIIDMQRDFLEPGGFGEALGNDVSQLRRTIEPTRHLLEAARGAGLAVIHTREGHRPDLADLAPAKKGRGNPSLKIGDQVTIEGFLPKDGTKAMGNARRVTLADGRRVFGGSSAPDAANQ